MSGVGDEVCQARYDHGIRYLRIHIWSGLVVDGEAQLPNINLMSTRCKRHFAPGQVAGPTMDLTVFFTYWDGDRG